jgi:hypothetical protein
VHIELGGDQPSLVFTTNGNRMGEMPFMRILERAYLPPSGMQYQQEAFSLGNDAFEQPCSLLTNLHIY